MRKRTQAQRSLCLLLGIVLLASITGCGGKPVPVDGNTGAGLSADNLNERKAPEEDVAETIPAEPPKEVSPTVDITTLPAGTELDESSIDRDHLDSYFVASEIPGSVFERINGRSYRDNPNISLGELRYLKVLHYNFDHRIQVGELIVNASLAGDFTEIFKELFSQEYEIQSMYLVDNYWTGDGTSSDSASIAENNTSAFCYRAITGGSGLSNHAYGKAIDINPRQNPYFEYINGAPVWGDAFAGDYLDRSSGKAHIITHEDACFKAFEKHGFTWGGDWNNPVDYQHFEKQ
jgi:hypothetical protein